MCGLRMRQFGVRMGKKRYAPDEVMRAVSLVTAGGMSLRGAERATGVSRETIRRWRAELESGAGSLYAVAMGAGDRKEGPMDEGVRLDDLPDDPEELKRIIFDMQFEIDLTRAAVEILKKGPGADPGALSNREKAALVDALSRKASPTGRPYSISFLASSLRLARQTFYRLRKRAGEDPDADIRDSVVAACASHPGFGYRRVRRLVGPVSEKRVRRVMRQEGLQAARRRPSSRYSSYSASEDVSELPNVPLREDGTHRFFSDAPDRLWVTDVTEFALPCGDRVYLSPLLDCYDGYLPGWRISTSAGSAELTDPSLEAAVAARDPAPGLVVHSDRGGQYHARSWASICWRRGIVRSMSRKGHSPDNARMEGFFGRLKMEFFDTRGWRGVSAGEFAGELDRWLTYYNEERPKESLGWMSPLQYRRSTAAA